MGLAKNILKQLLNEAQIIEKEKLSESVYAITLQADQIKKANFYPGYFLRVGVGLQDNETDFQDAVRSYSVWSIDQTLGTIKIAVATHSKGKGSQWAERSNVGDVVYYKWKKGNFLLNENADYFLFIGDTSALSHLYMIHRSLPLNKEVDGLIYSQNLKDFFADNDGSTPFRFYEMPLNPIAEIISEIHKKLEKKQGNAMVYIAGDSRVCVALNKYFKNELKWNSKQIKTKPFWNPHKKGLE